MSMSRLKNAINNAFTKKGLLDDELMSEAPAATAVKDTLTKAEIIPTQADIENADKEQAFLAGKQQYLTPDEPQLADVSYNEEAARANFPGAAATQDMIKAQQAAWENILTNIKSITSEYYTLHNNIQNLSLETSLQEEMARMAPHMKLALQLEKLAKENQARLVQMDIEFSKLLETTYLDYQTNVAKQQLMQASLRWALDKSVVEYANQTLETKKLTSKQNNIEKFNQTLKGLYTISYDGLQSQIPDNIKPSNLHKTVKTLMQLPTSHALSQLLTKNLAQAQCHVSKEANQTVRDGMIATFKNKQQEHADSLAMFESNIQMSKVSTDEIAQHALNFKTIAAKKEAELIEINKLQAEQKIARENTNKAEILLTESIKQARQELQAHRVTINSILAKRGIDAASEPFASSKAQIKDIGKSVLATVKEEVASRFDLDKDATHSDAIQFFQDNIIASESVTKSLTEAKDFVQKIIDENNQKLNEMAKKHTQALHNEIAQQQTRAQASFNQAMTEATEIQQVANSEEQKARTQTSHYHNAIKKLYRDVNITPPQTTDFDVIASKIDATTATIKNGIQSIFDKANSINDIASNIQTSDTLAIASSAASAADEIYSSVSNTCMILKSNIDYSEPVQNAQAVYGNTLSAITAIKHQRKMAEELFNTITPIKEQYLQYQAQLLQVKNALQQAEAICDTNMMPHRSEMKLQSAIYSLRSTQETLENYVRSTGTAISQAEITINNLLTSQRPMNVKEAQDLTSHAIEWHKQNSRALASSDNIQVQIDHANNERRLVQTYQFIKQTLLGEANIKWWSAQTNWKFLGGGYEINYQNSNGKTESARVPHGIARMYNLITNWEKDAKLPNGRPGFWKAMPNLTDLLAELSKEGQKRVANKNSHREDDTTGNFYQAIAQLCQFDTQSINATRYTMQDIRGSIADFRNNVMNKKHDEPQLNMRLHMR